MKAAAATTAATAVLRPWQWPWHCHAAGTRPSLHKLQQQFQPGYVILDGLRKSHLQVLIRAHNRLREVSDRVHWLHGPILHNPIPGREHQPRGPLCVRARLRVHDVVDGAARCPELLSWGGVDTLKAAPKLHGTRDGVALLCGIVEEEVLAHVSHRVRLKLSQSVLCPGKRILQLRYGCHHIRRATIADDDTRCGIELRGLAVVEEDGRSRTGGSADSG
mmetsp:Transcript_71809/g.166100  ORF Transcript_71809/g.166100 Transcript_71809/m.166100 type:complete len:219 (+) Transcript_71809:12-668(+)